MSDELEQRIRFLEGRITAISCWLADNQPDVWARGLWDAINDPEDPGDSEPIAASTSELEIDPTVVNPMAKWPFKPRVEETHQKYREDYD